MTSDDFTVKNTELAEEIASGRFATRATMGMLIQNGLTGSV